MTPRALLRTWSVRLAIAVVACALAVGLAAAGLVRVVAAWAGMAWPSSMVLALAAGAAVAALEGYRRLRGVLTPQRVALWLEERAPDLQFALVSAAGGGVAGAWCEARVRGVDVARPAWRSIGRSMRGPAAAGAVGLAALLAAPRLARVPASIARQSDRALAPQSALAGFSARIVPPAYSGLAEQRVREPDVLHPLVGSAVELTGPLPPPASPGDLAVAVDQRAVPAGAGGEGWRFTLGADTAVRVIRLAHGAASRLVVVEPRMDSLPVVALHKPERDTVLREGTGVVSLRARAADDLGVVSAGFEYIVSSGSGERFTFRTGTIGAVRPARQRTADLSAELDLAGLALGPGDVVHLRAVARDANTVTGPGVGASDTRTIRVARAGEYDSVAVEAAPPPEVDTSLLSQRMLINLTEALVRRQRTLDRPVVVAESRRLARDQARLRKQVSDIVFSRLGDDAQGEHFHGDGHQHGENEPIRRDLTPEALLAAAEKATGAGQQVTEAGHDETPVVAINRPLLEAYNAMWEAGRALDGGEPRAALPPMYAALAAIQKARAAERLYLRGVPPRVVVDVNRVRLQGRERGADAVRPTRVPAEPLRRMAMARLQRALALESASAAADTLLLVRLALLGRVNDAAVALDALVGDLRTGRDATTSALRVRRALETAAARADSVADWGTWR